MFNQRLTKNDRSLAGFESFFPKETIKKLRNSFDGSDVPSIFASDYRVTISDQQLPICNAALQKKQSKTSKNLKDQLSSIQDKLNKAKVDMSMRLPNQDEKQKQTQLQSKGSLFKKGKIGSKKALPAKFVSQQTQRKGKRQQFMSNHHKLNNITTFFTNHYSSIKNSQYYVAEVVRARHEKNSLAVQHINTSISLLKLCKGIEKIIQVKRQIIFLPLQKENRKTLFLDLDETLIHCLDNMQCEPDLRLKVLIEGEEVDVDITIRPYTLTFLKKISKKWEVVVFTASHRSYADAVLNEIDPEGELFHHRLYREHCIHINDLYIKDLSRVNRQLDSVVLVDNAASSFCLQLGNGIPILSFYDGKDFELSALEGYLACLEKAEDVRVVNEAYFKLDRYASFNNSYNLIKELYCSEIPSNL